MNTLSLWIFEILVISFTRPNELKNFPANFVVVKLKDAVTLTCGNADGAVRWKFEDNYMNDVDFEDRVQQVGQNLTVSNVDSPMLGEYSCWNETEKLSSTYLLLWETNDADSPLTCRAKSYDCSFSCNWTCNRSTLVRLGLGPDCRVGGTSCQWVSSSDDGGFQFELSHSLSPYAEESTMLEVTAQAIVNYSFRNRTKRFYLRNIVQPDSPEIVTCEEVGEYLKVTINPPSSWSGPFSFFKLDYEIEYVLKDDGTTKRSLSTLIPKRISKLRVRSRDPLVPSTWSQWTPWKNVKTKKLCKCKNKAKYCCPELSPEFLEKCKKRREKKRNKDPK